MGIFTKHFFINFKIINLCKNIFYCFYIINFLTLWDHTNLLKFVFNKHGILCRYFVTCFKKMLLEKF